MAKRIKKEPAAAIVENQIDEILPEEKKKTGRIVEPEFVFLINRFDQKSPFKIPAQRFKKNPDIYKSYVRVYPQE